ncbi:hypothetical protein CIK06_19700 [Plantactinospora sp. KBS50]|nr:hypothetical protein CIK06_19700 [Plantactinospora sp. KBS50]
MDLAMTDLLTGPVTAGGGLAVYGAAALDRPDPAGTLTALAAAGTPGRLADIPRRSRELLPQVAELCDELADLGRVVLVGAGAAALAPAAMARTVGRPLTVVDDTDPGRIGAALGGPLERTVVVVSAESGSASETDSRCRACLRALLDSGRSAAEAGRHLVVVTAPDSPAAKAAAGTGAFVVPADPRPGGPFSALTAYGLVPAALAGVAVVELLDQAQELAGTLTGERDNPALALGGALGTAAALGRDRVLLRGDGTGLDGLGDWIARLLAGATGGAGLGIRPTVVEPTDHPGPAGPDTVAVSYGGALRAGDVPGGGTGPDLAVNGPLGAQFLAWEYAAAVAAGVLGVDPFQDPFHQPDDADPTGPPD